MTEYKGWEPAPWSASETFAQTQAKIRDDMSRGISEQQKKGTKASDLVPKYLETTCLRPLILALDDTGSMGKATEIAMGKFGYVANEVSVYLGADAEIALIAIGDHETDKYPLQVCPFAKGETLAVHRQKLTSNHEGGGGGNAGESYLLTALYLLKNMRTPEATQKPLFISVGDEPTLTMITPAAARTFHIVIERAMTATEIFAQALVELDCYHIQLPFSGQHNLETVHQWRTLLGRDRVILLSQVGRVADVILALLAKSVNRLAEFHAEITARQEPEQVKVVYEALATAGIYPATAADASNDPHRSQVLHAMTLGPRAKKLV